MDLKNKTVTVVGLGNSGLNASLLLNSVGARVRVTDSGNVASTTESRKLAEEKGVKVETGGHTEDFIKGSELVVVSPGIEESSPALLWARKYRIPVIGEMELGFNFCKGRIIAITGTNGKSTVTTLIGHILKTDGRDTVVCGNIGNSLSGEVGHIKEDTWVVLEVSSFQLETIRAFKPNIALVLNITDDHMDRYKTFDEYFNEKSKVFSNQDERDFLILNQDAVGLSVLQDKASSKVLFYSRSRRTNGAYAKDGKIFSSLYDGSPREVCAVDDIPLKGTHNVENFLASILAASIAGVKEDTIKSAVKSFKGLPHRFETIATIGGVRFIDDSKGTTVDSTVRALESCIDPVVLIAGGKDKHSDYSRARQMVKKKVSHLVLIGEARTAIQKALKGACPMSEARDMFDAVDTAYRLTGGKGAVLLSPMCSSFDMFKDYKERGEIFKEAVGRLGAQTQKAAA